MSCVGFPSPDLLGLGLYVGHTCTLGDCFFSFFWVAEVNAHTTTDAHNLSLFRQRVIFGPFCGREVPYHEIDPDTYTVALNMLYQGGP